MKKTATLLLAVCIACSATMAQTKSPDSLIRGAFNALKQNNQQAYEALFPTYAQTRAMLDQMVAGIKDSTMHAQVQASLGQLNEETFNMAIKPRIGQSFQEVQQQAKSQGLDWNTAVLDSFPYHEETQPGIDMTALAGEMYVTSSGKSYVIPFGEILHSGDAYYGIELKGLQTSTNPSKDTKIDLGPVDESVKTKSTPKKTVTKTATPATKVKTKTKG